MRLKISEIAALLHAELSRPTDANMDGAAIDNRAVSPGNLFVCLPGKRADGHDFAPAAAQAGACAILASRPLPDVEIPVLVVADAEKSLQSLAAFCRAQTKARTLCLTGTAGKTTLKDALAAIMRQKGAVAATAGNHNNQIGLPLTILNATGAEDFWILEAGISHAGDMDLLGGIARPDIAVILNVGPGHTEGLGDKGVAWHKARLLRYLEPAHGRALVSADYPELVQACGAYAVKPEFFSRQAGADCKYKLAASGAGWQEMLLNGRLVRFNTPFIGVFGAETALAAAAAASMLGADDAEIAAGFAAAQLPAQRFRQMELAGAIVLIDDTYNANPLSMRRALACAASEAKSRNLPFYAVLGAMGELGESAEACHHELGRQLEELQPAGIVWTGPYADAVAAGFGSAAIPQVKDAVEFADFWQSRQLPKQRMLILFKGSRANGLEKYIQAFRQMLPHAEAAHVL